MDRYAPNSFNGGVNGLGNAVNAVNTANTNRIDVNNNAAGGAIEVVDVARRAEQ